MFGMTITLVQAQRLPTRKIRVTIQLSREEAVFKTKPKSLWMIHQLSLLLCLTLGVGSVKAQPVDFEVQTSLNQSIFGQFGKSGDGQSDQYGTQGIFNQSIFGQSRRSAYSDQGGKGEWQHGSGNGWREVVLSMGLVGPHSNIQSRPSSSQDSGGDRTYQVGSVHEDPQKGNSSNTVAAHPRHHKQRARRRKRRARTSQKR